MSSKNWTDDKLLSRLKHNKSDRSRWNHISILRKRISPELFVKCVDLTRSDNPRFRAIGIDILAQFGIPPRRYIKQTLKLYFELLNRETEPTVLMSLLYAINFNNENLNKQQIEKLCSFSNSDNPLIKEGLVFALQGINSPGAIDVLIRLSADKTSFIRNWATFGIGTQVNRDNKKIREALWKGVNDKHQETKLEAIVGLAKRKDGRVNEMIKRELIKDEYGSLLFDAIIETKDCTFLPLLRQSLKQTKGDPTIKPTWKKELKNCILELKNLTKK
jgi:HEAT repeat protein